MLVMLFIFNCGEYDFYYLMFNFYFLTIAQVYLITFGAVAYKTYTIFLFYT